MTRRRWIILGSSLTALIAVAIVVGVISAGGESSSVADDAPAGPLGQASEELQACLEDQGLGPGSGPPSGFDPSDGPPQGFDPGSAPPAGSPDQDMQQAFEACQHYLPEGGFPTPPSGGGLSPPSG